MVTDPIPHGDVPVAIYRPLLVRRLLHLPAPSHVYVRVLFAVIVVSALVAAAGRLTRLAGWVCAFGMLDWLSNAMSYSKIDHDHFALVLTLFVLPTVGAARVSDMTRDRAAGWALRLVQMGVVASYALSAWAKMRFGGWDWANGATLIWALSRRGPGAGPRRPGARPVAGEPAAAHARDAVGRARRGVLLAADAVAARAGARGLRPVLVRLPPEHVGPAEDPLPAAGRVPAGVRPAGAAAARRLVAGPGAGAQTRGQDSTRRRRTSSSSIGSAFVWAMTGRKLESPPHRGTTCWCRCALTPAPATAPWFMPML